MKITPVAPSNQSLNPRQEKKSHNNVAFKSAGMAVLGFTTTVMQGIEKGGYLISFLIQDGLGMTAPRVWTGFQRDKDITGQYNVQEGFEVLGREGLTGPFIMFVAPVTLAVSSLFCKSTKTNTTLIKRLGRNLKTMISAPEFDNSIKNDKKQFKDAFYKYNIEKIYKNTVKNDTNPEETVAYILKEIEGMESKDKKVRNLSAKNISKKINEKMLETSKELYNLDQVSIGEGADAKPYGTIDAMEAIVNYAHDAIIKNPDAKNMDAEAADNIKNNFATKRMLFNIGSLAATLTGLFYLPKLYIRSNISPGAKAMQFAKEKADKENLSSSQDKDTKEIAFKGKGINNKGIFSSAGEFLTKKIPEKFNELFEYAGYNFTKTTFACFATFGLLLPRGKKAWDRAQVNEKGKRDMTEIHEILLRDTVSSLSVVFAVPLLTKAIVGSYEKKSGFVLTNNASEGKSKFKKFLDVINPYSKLDVLSIAQLDSMYGNIDNKTKLLNFSQFIDKNGGDLEKILSKSEQKNVMFNDKTFTLESIKNESRKDKNAKIISLFEKIKDDRLSNEGISKLMNGTAGARNNKITKFARGLNSVPGFISTWIISPLILGFMLPKLTYILTKRAHARQLEENKKTA